MRVHQAIARQKRLAVISLLLFTQLHAQQYGWTKIAQPATSFISAVNFVDSLNGWIGCILADADKSIFRTRDGGYTWQRQIAPLPPNIRSIGFSDLFNGWIVGNLGNAFGYIIHTSNGGQFWQEQRRLLYRNYIGLGAHNPLEATVTGSLDSFFTTAGLIVRTSDGGKNWREQRYLSGIFQADFVDARNGWASATIGDSARFIHTKDSGQTWLIQGFPLQVITRLRAFDFFDSLHGWGLGIDARIDNYPVVIGTTDGGNTWQRLHKFPADGTSRIFVDIDFADTLNGWLIGSAIVDGRDQGEIYRTTDGGQSWTVEMRDPRIFATQGFALDSQHVWAGTTLGEIIRYGSITTVQEREAQIPAGYALLQNYPNPFNPITQIEYHLPKRTRVLLTVHDLLGKEVRTLVRAVQGPGVYQVPFDAGMLTAGAYFYTLKTDDFEQTQTMTLLK